jgi:hypothetical protein
MLQFVSAERIGGKSTNDNLTGTPDNDLISGSGGNDTSVGLAGIDEIDGGRDMELDLLLHSLIEFLKLLITR